ncbi:ComF family protein [Actinomycetes bacterium M1A6_2h]
MNTLLDLILPRECGGCGRAGTDWCAACGADLAADPIEVCPRVEVGVPCWALGAYSGPRRRSVVAAKERGRRDLAQPLGDAVAGAVLALRQRGEIDPWQLSSLTLVPAPSRRSAARRRGGDPVERLCRSAARALRPERVLVAPVVGVDRTVRDSVGLSARARRHNLTGHVRVHIPADAATRLGTGTTILVDDVMTTGTTASETVRALASAGVAVDAVVVVASVL